MPAETVWITGGAGFVGSNVATYLAEQLPDAAIVAVDNLRRRGSELNIPRLRATGVRFIHADVRSFEDLAGISPQPTLIVECSAEASVLAGYTSSPDYLVHTNLNGCFHCLEIARRAGAAFLFVSTSRVYPAALLNSLAFEETPTRYCLAAGQSVPGASAEGIAETFPLRGVRSLYGMTKLASELMIEEYGAAFGMPYIVNRCGLLAGPWQMARADQGVMAQWVAAHRFGAPLRYIGFGGSGKQVRDLLHIEDFCELVLDQVRHFSLYAGKCWNVGGGPRFSLSLCEATGICEQLTGRKLEIGAELECRPFDIRLYATDHRAVSAVNGWAPRHGPARTLADIDAWLCANEKELRGVVLAGGQSLARAQHLSEPRPQATVGGPDRAHG